MIGKKNKFPAIIKQLSPAMLEFMVDRLRVLAQLIASIKEGHTSTAAVVEFLLRDIEKLGMSKTEFMAACAKVVDVEAQDVAKPNCCTTSKHFVQRIVASCWQPLPDWLKTVAQLSVLGGVNVAGSIVAPALIKAGVADAGFDFLVAHATGRAGSALTEEYDCEYKVLGGAAVYGGCRALTTLAGVNTYTVATGALIYLIYSLFSDFSDFVGLKETFMKEFKDLPAGFDELLSIYLTKVRMHIQKKLAHEDVEVGYGPELV